MGYVYNFKDWTLNEQDRPGKSKIDKTVAISKDPEMNKLSTLFVKYLESKVPKEQNMKIDDWVNAVLALSDEELQDVIQFFKSEGDPMPNKQISRYQSILGVNRFKNIEGVVSKFKDGVFGVATAKANRRYYTDQLKKLVASRKNGWTWADNTVSRKHVQKKIEKGEITAARKKEPIEVGTKKKVPTEKINVGTQTFK